jgi:hypothetical protein
MVTVSAGTIYPHRIASIEFDDKRIKVKLVDGGQVQWPNRGASSIIEGELVAGVAMGGNNCESAVYANGATWSNQAQQGAIAALVKLGQSKQDAIRHVNEAMEKLEPTTTTEAILAAALGRK